MLNQSKANYVIIGGLAVIKWGRPRMTQDIDIIISINDEEIENLTQILNSAGFLIEASEIRLAFAEKSHVSIFFPKKILRIDLKGIYSHLDDITIENKRKTTIFNVETWIESPEDLIVAKLVYGSGQDLEDAKSVISLQSKKIDTSYLKRRAREENVLDLLNEITNDLKNA